MHASYILMNVPLSKGVIIYIYIMHMHVDVTIWSLPLNIHQYSVYSGLDRKLIRCFQTKLINSCHPPIGEQAALKYLASYLVFYLDNRYVTYTCFHVTARSWPSWWWQGHIEFYKANQRSLHTAQLEIATKVTETGAPAHVNVAELVLEWQTCVHVGSSGFESRWKLMSSFPPPISSTLLSLLYIKG